MSAEGGNCSPLVLKMSTVFKQHGWCRKGRHDHPDHDRNADTPSGASWSTHADAQKATPREVRALSRPDRCDQLTKGLAACPIRLVPTRLYLRDLASLLLHIGELIAEVVIDWLHVDQRCESKMSLRLELLPGVVSPLVMRLRRGWPFALPQLVQNVVLEAILAPQRQM